MTPDVPDRTRETRPRRVVAALTGLLTAVVLTAPLQWTGAASAQPPAPTSQATALTISTFTSSVVTPATPGAPPVLVAVAPDTVGLTVELVDESGASAPVSKTKDTVVRVEVVDACVPQPDRPCIGFAPGVVMTATVPAGGTTATFSALALSQAANQVTLRVRVIDGTKDARALPPVSTDPFDVVLSHETERVPVEQLSSSLLVSRAGVGQACEPTLDAPVCTDLVLPNGLTATDGSVSPDVFFSTALCDGDVGCSSSGGLLQVLADFEYERSAPATVIVKCDKSLCGGGGVPSQQLQVSLSGTGLLTTAPACKEKGVVNGPVVDASGEVVDEGLFCLDYVQSKRDYAGDLHMYLLLVRDARMSCC